MAGKSKIHTERKPRFPRQNSIFGLAPILEDEDAEAHDDLIARVLNAVKPSDVIEEILARDVIDLTWESLRWLRLRTSRIEIAMFDALERFLEPHMPSQPSETKGIYTPSPASPAHKLIKKLVARKPAAINRVNKILSSANLTMDTVMSLAFANVLEDINRIDRFITNIRWRRNAILREIYRRRSTFARGLGNTGQDTEKSNKATKSKLSAQRMKQKKMRHG